MTFGERLKLLRTEKELTQTELGKHFNLGKTAISLYETDDRFPDKEILDKMADFFDCSLDYLLGRVDVKKTEENVSDFHVGLSRKDEGLLTEEDKQDIKNFAEFVINKRKNPK